MIEFDGIRFNSLISKRIMQVLVDHDQSLKDIDHGQLGAKVTKIEFMAAVAKVNNMPFFPRVAEFCESALLEKCDPSVLTEVGFLRFVLMNIKSSWRLPTLGTLQLMTTFRCAFPSWRLLRW